VNFTSPHGSFRAVDDPSDARTLRRGSVGCVIVTHSRLDLARRCAQSVLTEVEPQSTVVVVNRRFDSHDENLRWLQANVATVAVNDTPRGYGANLNTGRRLIRNALGRREPDYYLLLNDDVILAPGAIANLERCLGSHEDVAIASPCLCTPGGVPLPARARFPSVPGEIAEILILPESIQRRLRDRYSHPPVSHPDVSSHAWPVGAVLLVRSSALSTVGGFDESFFLYSEETDLAYRLRQAGWRFAVSRSAVATHLGAQSTGDSFQRLLGLSRWRYIEKHWSLTRRGELVVALPLAYAWNTAYVALRVVFAPSSLRPKMALWRSRWRKRPLPF
jgi:N-acetylglucosaminyl-diphospho-decaprenol L-rhamnosyltransferase